MFELIDDSLDNCGKVLLCDEYYTTMSLVEECTSRNIPFLGRISSDLLTLSPQMMLRAQQRSFRVFCEKVLVWICWDRDDLPPLLLVSNFHQVESVTDSTDWTKCSMLKLYNKCMFGSETFDRVANVYENDKLHPMCSTTMNTVFYSVLNATVLNTKIVADRKASSKQCNIFQHAFKILLSYSISEIVLEQDDKSETDNLVSLEPIPSPQRTKDGNECSSPESNTFEEQPTEDQDKYPQNQEELSVAENGYDDSLAAQTLKHDKHRLHKMEQLFTECKQVENMAFVNKFDSLISFIKQTEIDDLDKFFAKAVFNKYRMCQVNGLPFFNITV